MVKVLQDGPAKLDEAPPMAGLRMFELEFGLEQARRGPNAGMRNRRNEARLLLFACAGSDHGPGL